MMMSLESYKSMVSKMSYEELITERNNLIFCINEYECDEMNNETKDFVLPSQEDVYLMNLQCLAVIVKVMLKEFSKKNKER